MPVVEFVIKQGDLLPILSATLQDQDGNTADLSAFSSIELRYRLPGGATTVKTATIDDAPNGLVSYTWVAGDTDVAGVYQAEWRGLSGTKQQTWPTPGYFNFAIVETL